MRRGFKEEMKRLVSELRGELGLDAHASLDPRDLAEQYGIPVFPLTEMSEWGCSPETLAHYASDSKATFSAALIPCGTSRMIIDNDNHAPTRRRASLAHEMGHVLLEHPFTEAVLTADGCRAVHPDLEEEAHWFGGELLIPFDAATTWARRGASNDEVASHHGVSVQYAGMRMNTSGAREIARRRAAAGRR
jgi:Zn-dependent peptidase ImmA (M78 family)